MTVLRGLLDQYLYSENRLTRSTLLEVHGVPKIDIRWRFTQADRASVLTFFNRLRARFSSGCRTAGQFRFASVRRLGVGGAALAFHMRDAAWG